MNKGQAETHRRRKALKKAYGALYSDLLVLFYKADPIGLASHAPPDEYSSEVETVLPRLSACHGPDDVQRVLHEEFCRWFDADLAGPPAQYRVLAVQVWRAFVEGGQGVQPKP